MNPDAYTIVELQDEANASHCRRANADEIIIGNELTSNMIARAALDHGITKVISEVLSIESGNELYKIPVPEQLVNQTILDTISILKTSYKSTLLAVQNGPLGEVVSNPPADQRLNATDFLIVLAADRPVIR
jgi:voltage-gated potassium channel